MKRFSLHEAMDRATQAAEEFSGHSNERRVQRIYVPPLKVVWELGKLDHIGYETKRDGEIALYRHVFEKSSRPHLVVSEDGKQIGIVGGRFRVTDAGITDY